MPVKVYKRGMKIPNYSYIVAGNGFFFKKENELFSAIIPAKEVPIDKLAPMVESKVKIPAKQLVKIVSFFRSMSLYDSNEVMCQIFYTGSKIEVSVPEQVVSCASISYKPKFHRGWICVGTIHSHGLMSAFHSMTDIRDEKEKDGIHFVIGKLQDDHPQISCSIAMNGYREVVDPSYHITGKVVIRNSRIFFSKGLKNRSYPSNWKQHVKNYKDIISESEKLEVGLKVPVTTCDYLDIEGLTVEELRLVRKLRIPISKFVTVHSGVCKEEARRQNLDILEQFAYLEGGLSFDEQRLNY